MRPSELIDMMVGDILMKWPDTATAFHRHKMACPGCVMAPFMSLAEACAAYDTPLDAVATSLVEYIDGPLGGRKLS